jgi:hypothetical protein
MAKRASAASAMQQIFTLGRPTDSMVEHYRTIFASRQMPSTVDWRKFDAKDLAARSARI